MVILFRTPDLFVAAGGQCSQQDNKGIARARDTHTRTHALTHTHIYTRIEEREMAEYLRSSFIFPLT